jgi:hypothetical protein
MILDFLRGSLNVFLIMVVAGGIAYVGDRVGHQVGRRRLTLFGIRPRYTSTIVAIGTGMLIAFSVTMVALLASKEVRTAFFRLSQLNTQITTLREQEAGLEAKVNNAQLVVPVNAPMVPFYATVKKGEAVDARMRKIYGFYQQSVQYMNTNLTLQGLKRYTPPSNWKQKLDQEFGTPEITNLSQASDLLLVITSPQNLYRDDKITFYVDIVPDELIVNKGGVLWRMVIPGGSNASSRLAVAEMQQQVANFARTQLKLPPFLADNVATIEAFPSLADMQKMLASPGNYVLTAYAAQDIYPHVGGVPIVVTLTQVK